MGSGASRLLDMEVLGGGARLAPRGHVRPPPPPQPRPGCLVHWAAAELCPLYKLIMGSGVLS